MKKLIPFCWHLVRHYVFQKDTREWITPITLRHIKRYQFAQKHLFGKKILDVGCGTGYGSQLLREKINYTGIDIDERCINFAKKNFKGRFIKASFLNYSFVGKSFETVICFEVLEHLKAPYQALNKISEFLTQRGRLIISIPLNHPDKIYHKKVYNYSSTKRLLAKTKKYSVLGEFLQIHLTITPIVKKLDDRTKGTYLGIWKKRR